MLLLCNSHGAPSAGVVQIVSSREAHLSGKASPERRVTPRSSLGFVKLCKPSHRHAHMIKALHHWLYASMCIIYIYTHTHTEEEAGRVRERDICTYRTTSILKTIGAYITIEYDIQNLRVHAEDTYSRCPRLTDLKQTIRMQEGKFHGRSFELCEAANGPC